MMMDIAELRLLLCSLSVPKVWASQVLLTSDKDYQQDHPALANAIDSIVTNVEKGAFINALSGDPVRFLLWDASFWTRESTETAEEFYNSVSLCVNSFIDGDGCQGQASSRALLVMAVGVAALDVFWQANVMGPSVNPPPCASLILSHEMQKFKEEDYDVWAQKQPMVDGCDLVGSCFCPQYLILAKILLVDTLKMAKGLTDDERELRSHSWWACRTLLAQQKVLVERSPSLHSALSTLKSDMLKRFGSIGSSCAVTLQQTTVDREVAAILMTATHLECGIVDYTYSHVDKARERFEVAKEACNLQFHLTGVLGFRTAHQVDPKAQMVLVTSTQSNPSDQTSPAYDRNRSGKLLNSGDERSPWEEDILMVPKLVGAVRDADTVKNDEWKEPGRLNSLQQAVILAHCLDIKKSNPDDELRGWQMAPFIEAVDTQPSSHFMVKCCCELFRIRWEYTRSRTMQRALIMMEELVGKIKESNPEGQERMPYAFCVSFPTLCVVLKEYADMMVSCGMIGDALRIFEELELWNDVIDCYRLLGKRAAAVDLIKDRLQHQPDDPRLWCALGDVTLNEECYVKSWEVSKHRFAQAQRSLGQFAYNKGDYAQSIKHWEAALNLNSLHPNGWFALGSAALKAGELNKALDSYTRAVQLDPDNGEAWNNIAAIHMTRKRSKEAFFAFREALKFRRSSWQMWENYAHVALDVQNFGQAIEALQMVLELSQGKRANVDCITKLMDELEARSESGDTQAEAGTIEVQNQMTTNSSGPVTSACWSQDENANDSIKELDHKVSDDGMVRSHPQVESNGRQEIVETKQHFAEREWLMERVGKLLSKVVQNCQHGAVWGLLARWHRLKGDFVMCSEALLKQARSLQGSDWQHSTVRFHEFCQVSLQLCEVYTGIASKTGSKRELYSAQMLLRNLIKQGENFSNTDDFVAVESCLLNIQRLLMQAS